jgi:hypothetical protein
MDPFAIYETFSVVHTTTVLVISNRSRGKQDCALWRCYALAGKDSMLLDVPQCLPGGESHSGIISRLAPMLVSIRAEASGDSGRCVAVMVDNAYRETAMLTDLYQRVFPLTSAAGLPVFVVQDMFHRS